MFFTKAGYPTVEAPASAAVYWQGRGYTPGDPTVPDPIPGRIVSNIAATGAGVLTIYYLDGGTDTVPVGSTTGGTTSGGIALDEEGLPYYSPGGAISLALDDEGLPYLTGL